MKDALLNLDDLTEEERESILLVLKRNEELQSAQDTRITEIKSQINAIRMNAVLRQGEDGTKICSRCREPFGFFFNSGEICAQCKCKVCKTCREYTLKGDWICVLCYKQRQLKALSGEWLVPSPPEVPEEQTDSLNLSVPELVRKSIRRKSSHSNDDEDGQDNRSIYIEQTNNDVGSSSDGSSVHGVEYPKESDKQKLSSLLSQSHLQPPSPINNNNKLVQKVSTKRYEDSESCSSDNDDEMETKISAQTASLHSSAYAFSTDRMSPASDMEDGSYPADGNGTSLTTSNHHTRDNMTFDDSSYRAHSELPDVDDLIVKSKARMQHSPLSSMTSSPTPSSVGQRLLDLANSAENSDTVSINASENTDASSVQGDSGNITATSQDSSSPPSHSKNPSDMSLPSINVSGVDEEEDEPVDDIVSQPKTPSSTFHQTFGSLFSSFGGSRESIASYYSQAGGGTYGVVKVKGTIQFAVDYKYKVGTLEVVVKQCTELAAVDEKKERSDPYVKTYLLPDRTRTGKRKTQVKKNSLDPVFNETLRYHLTKSELSNRTLWLSVWNHDRFGRNVFLGEVTLPLTYYNFSSSPQWYNLQEREEMEPDMVTYKGDLIVSLKYVPLENMTESTEGKTKKKPKEGQLCVLIKEAKNLTATRANGYSDSFCKGYLLPEKGKSVKQKTEVVKKNLSPKWNYLFTFEDISFEELPDRCLELTVWDHDRFSSNDFLGGVRLNIGTGTSKGKEVNWMDARGEEIAVWQSMVDQPNVWVDATLNLRPNMDKIE